MLASIWSKICFCIIDYNFNVINLSILVMYNVQYDAIAYGYKINWILLFVNHKRTTHTLNALIIIFYNVCVMKMCGFINLLLKFNIYVFLSRSKSFKNLVNVMFSLVLNFF
jgi:hypothetical protein